MRIDKVGEYRTSNGQRVIVNTISSGRAYGCIMDGYWFVGPSCWQVEDGSQSHPARADLRIVSEWVATKQQDDLRLIVARTLGRLQGLQRYSPVPELYLAMSPDIDGDWLEAGEMLTAIKDLRRAIGDCTLDQEA